MAKMKCRVDKYEEKTGDVQDASEDIALNDWNW